MSYGKSLRSALYRSVDALKHGTAKAMRMQVAPTSASQGPVDIWTMNSPQDLDEFATGCDKDIGGLSTARLDIDQGHGRFWGTLSNQVPRGARIERTGYAGMRNRNRPTLFGLQTWDTSLHPFLAFRIRNSIARTTPPSPVPPSTFGLTGGNFAALSPEEKAKISLGYGVEEPLGPKFFINVQTDGPVTSDLFQHRLWFDPAAADEWQTVVLPLERFLLLNTGTLSTNQLSMMREAIRTVGISCTLDTPRLPASATPAQGASTSTSSSAAGKGGSTAAPSALRAAPGDSVQTSPAGHQMAAEPPNESRRDAAQGVPIETEDDFGRDGGLHNTEKSATSSLRGIKRGQSFRFDLGIAGVRAVGSVEEAHELNW